MLKTICTRHEHRWPVSLNLFDQLTADYYPECRFNTLMISDLIYIFLQSMEMCILILNIHICGLSPIVGVTLHT